MLRFWRRLRALRRVGLVTDEDEVLRLAGVKE